MRQVNFPRIVLSFVISTILFVSVFMISHWVIISEYQKNIEIQQQLGQQLSFIDSNSLTDCDDHMTNISIELDNAGIILGILEEKMGKNNPDVISQKENYSLLELRHLYGIKKYIRYCGKDATTILFFYSNQNRYSDDAEQKGYILSKIKRDNPEGIMIYSFDYDLNTETVNMLKELYHISKPNIIVINEQVVVADFNDIDNIKGYI